MPLSKLRVVKSFCYCCLLVLFVFTACTKTNGSSTAVLNETIPAGRDSSAPERGGVFMNGPYGSVSGAARIFLQGGKYSLALQNILVSNGPDLHVYLSKEIQPINFIDLGKLKSTAGNQLYDIAGNPDFTVYPYILIHCQQYDHLFGSAPLK